MLSNQIEEARKLVKTDAYQMSIGELVNLYKDGDLVISPSFQRLFRWTTAQKSRLIESILLGIPLPSIFVFETPESKWELIDGLQRISTVLEFMGVLRQPGASMLAPPSVLSKTKYLPALEGAVWSEDFLDIPNSKNALDKERQFSIRRARIGIEILKQPSDNSTKFELFQRLNAGGTLANPQELRNCMVIMVNEVFFDTLKDIATSDEFIRVFGVTEDQISRQKHLE